MNNKTKPLRKPIIKNNVVHIPLGGKRGGIALVDMCNLWIADYNWSMTPTGYAQCHTKDSNNKDTIILMHYLVKVKPTKGLVIDHINRNKLDNRLENLRVVNHKSNTRNASLSKNNTSGYNGVSFNKECNKWQVRIVVDYKNLHIGLFKDIKDAIKARQKAELKYWGFQVLPK